MPIKQLSDGEPDGTVLGQSNADRVSMHGVAPVVRATVTGSRGANAALASLLTALAAKGIIIDGSSA